MSYSGDRILLGSERESRISKFRPWVLFVIPLIAILFQVYVPLFFQFLNFLDLPLLVFSSADDHTVKPANSSFVISHAGSTNKELVRLSNSYHVATLDYDADEIFERTLRFVHGVVEPPSV